MIAGDYPDQQVMDMLYFNKGNNKYIIQVFLQLTKTNRISLYEQKKYQEAVDCFIKAQLVESKQIETQIYLGLSLQCKKQLDLYKSFIGIKKQQNVLRMQQTKVIKMKKSIIKKVVCISILIGISLQLYILLLLFIQQLGQHIQAIRCFDQAILKCEKWPNAYKLKSKTIYNLFCLKQVNHQKDISIILYIRILGKITEAIKWEEKSKLLINEQAVTITPELLFSTNQSNSVSKIRQHY